MLPDQAYDLPIDARFDLHASDVVVRFNTIVFAVHQHTATAVQMMLAGGAILTELVGETDEVWHCTVTG